MEDIAVTKFREYLRVNTEQPNPDYAACQKFLFELADELGIQRRAVETAPGKPFIIMTIPGTSPELKTLMLYSHTDVVPTFKDKWTYDPYSAHKDENGDIYARGAQDMKCVGSQYVEAIRRHFHRGQKQWLRTIHIVWGPDEEIGGPEGMSKFCQMDEFRELNVGFILDEGLASETDIYKVYFAERCPWWVKIICNGSPGHGSKFIENTAGEKLVIHSHKFQQHVINEALAFREEQRHLLESDSKLTLGDVTTLNLTILEGGVQTNVLPEKFTAYFDIRFPPTVDMDEMERLIAGWCQKAGDGVIYEFIQVSFSRNSRHFRKCEFDKEIFTGATDSRFLRALGYRSIGFSPMNNTPSLLHDHNEYLNERVFLRGIEIYETLISNLANVEDFVDNYPFM
ncbi:unnamed protein product [Heligmosomoides polygyrus]|uniref:N-acyl-aliphatic-L-amino acid amidohydrolase n=1 Tax=Heligmosomoides polygyrus TaxID=6339 RepID=A0A3P8E4Y4_HELPZ|nr:unnamed protein product [Heligmosomoides polygyrus]